MRSKSFSICFVFFVLLVYRDLQAQQPIADQKMESHADHLPLIFEANRGQAKGDVRYLSRGNGYTVLLGSDKTVFVISPPAVAGDRGTQRQPAVITLELLGSNKTARPEGLDLLPGKSNYFIGKQPANWIAGIPQYGRVAFKSIYAGIDLVYHGNGGQLEYDLVLSAGANPKAISFRLKGADKVCLDVSTGNLSLQTAAGTIAIQRPGIYQEVEGHRRTVIGNFVLLGDNEVGFKIGNYDAGKPLVIDPVLSYSTLIGANNDTEVQGIAVDPTGDLYIVGTTFATDYPTVNAFQSTNHGTSNVFITKLNPAGDKILYSTYLGSSGFDMARGIAVDRFGSAYVTGSVGASDFPTTPGALMTTCSYGCNTSFVTKVLTDGSLSYSTFTGGSVVSWAIAVDTAGAAYITGGAGSDLLLVNPFQSTPASAFAQKLNPQGNALEYSTYLGGGGTEMGRGIAVDASGSASVVGETTDENFPLKNPIQSSQIGINLPNVFISKFSPDGAQLVFSTYLGGSSPFFFNYAGDYATGVAVDPLGNIHVVGTSSSCDFPLSLNALSTDCVITGYDQKEFVATLNSSGSEILFSTFLRSGVSSGIAVDRTGNSYVAGSTGSNNLPLLNPIESTVISGQSSASSFVTELDLSGKLLFSTYLGSTNAGSLGAGIAVDSKGGIYVAGRGQGDFPLLRPIPSQVKQNGYNTLFVSKISPRSAPQFSLSPRVSPLLTLRNVSSVPLNISAITPSANFTQGGDCGASLDPGTGCTLILQGAADNKTTGTVTISSNAYGRPQKFVISKSPTGDGSGPIITIFPAYIQFPSQLIGTTSPPQKIVIRNSGQLPGAINSILMIQPSAFNETNDCPAMLNLASYCTISITYTAESAQDSAQLAIVTDPNQTRYTVSLGGLGSTSAIALSTTSMEFGSRFVGAAPLGRIVNLTDTTPYPVSITGVSTSTGFAQTNTCAGVLASQASCRVSVSFAPTDNQDAPGTLTVANYGPGGPEVVNLHGTGIKPGDLDLSPASLSYSGFVELGTVPSTVTLTNNSQKTITIQSVDATGPFPQTNNCPGTLAPGAACQIFVSFLPAQAGAATGTLQVTFVGTGSPQTIALSGTAQTTVQFYPLSVQFNEQRVKTQSPQTTMFVENNGIAAVTLGSVSIQGSDFSIAQNTCGPSLARNTGCILDVVFTPAVTGLRTGMLSVTASDSSSPHTAVLQGIGVSSGIGTLSASTISFPAQVVGTQSSPAQVILTNTGNGALKLNGIAISPQFFTQTNTCGPTLAAGSNCAISVQFAPTLQGILVGSLSISDNGTGSPHTVALTGIGQ